MRTNLKKYQDKRNFNKTKEPIGKIEKEGKKLRFVIQHHLARRDHYDFRLEWNGTLKSWAVPKGPSFNNQDKRLAVHVEDHPLSYRNFEGIIPKGEYGGGTVMIFDEGFWEPLEDPKKGFQNGSLKFALKGKRLKGKWSLIYFKENNWLLIKEKDEYEGKIDLSKWNTSIKTDRTMEEIMKGFKKKKTSKIECIVENIEITHPEKIIYKCPKVTKLDIALYYQKVSKRMMPYLENRIVSTIRAPEGIESEQFFKKHFDNSNSGIGKKIVPTEKGHADDYYYFKNTEGLISEVQQNSFEFHIWGSQVNRINHPNMLVFDLDPDEKMSLRKIRQGVSDLKSILDDLSLTSFLKTSGGKGYHVVVPITSLKNWNSFKTFSQNIAKLMETKWPAKYTSNVRKDQRKNKIFIDWIRNAKSATSVAPYSLRLRKGAPVSMPISWKELNKIKPNEIKMKDALRRLKRKDPWEHFFDIIQ